MIRDKRPSFDLVYLVQRLQHPSGAFYADEELGPLILHELEYLYQLERQTETGQAVAPGDDLPPRLKG